MLTVHRGTVTVGDGCVLVQDAERTQRLYWSFSFLGEWEEEQCLWPGWCGVAQRWCWLNYCAKGLLEPCRKNGVPCLAWGKSGKGRRKWGCASKKGKGWRTGASHDLWQGALFSFGNSKKKKKIECEEFYSIWKTKFQINSYIFLKI